jgi:hypothetical protein
MATRHLRHQYVKQFAKMSREGQELEKQDEFRRLSEGEMSEIEWTERAAAWCVIGRPIPEFVRRDFSEAAAQETWRRWRRSQGCPVSRRTK